MTRLPGQGRLDVEDSLFDRLREVDPGITTMAVTKSTLVATSHLIETLVHEHRQRCVLVSGFQHGRQWAAERDRYVELAGDHDVIALFAGREPSALTDVDHLALRLRSGDPLAQEWFVLALGPGLAITLCGLDADAHAQPDGPAPEADRLFDVVFSVDPQIAATAADVVSAAVRRADPRRGDSVTALLAEAGFRPPTTAEAARTTDLLLAGMVQRLEVVRVRERGVVAAASQQKSSFLSRLSHELRTPLNAIVGFAQLLELDEQPPESREAVEQILHAGRSMVTLVDEILDIGRIESGGLQLDRSPVPLGPAVSAALALMGPAAAARSVVVRDLVGPGAPTVLADSDRLRQVLLNLVSNAVKYNVEGGRIEVSVVRTPDAVRLAVTDTGTGLTPHEISRLFVPFDRLGAPARGIAGTGLGLVVTRSLVEAMNGQLEVESRPGVGSTFTVALPHARSG